MQKRLVFFIQLYEGKPNNNLWDPNDPEYKNKFKRKNVLDDIAMELGVSNVEGIKTKLETLQVQYRQEKKLVTTKSGMGATERNKLWWGLFQFFWFQNNTAINIL